MSIFFYLIFTFLTLLIIFISKKYKFFYDNKRDNHKKTFNPQKNYFLGGLILFIFVSIFLTFKISYIELIFLFLIFLIGLFSDFRLLNDPKKRFILQAVVIFIFVSVLDTKIMFTRINIMDAYLQNEYLNYVFVVFCLMILINGSNFIDGLNTLLITYKIIILLTLLIVFEIYLNIPQYIYELFFVLLIIFIFNLFGKIILGDSGAYLISIIYGLSLINFSNEYYLFSPFFIILLLWYPCFELLHSMIRRIVLKKKSYDADTKHLHQLLYSKIFKNKKQNFKINHFTTSIIINLYNFISFSLGAMFIYNSEVLIFIIISNIFVYMIIYNFLKNQKKTNK